MRTKRKTFRVWHKTEFGVGYQEFKAKDKESIRIPKWIVKAGIIDIEETGNE